MIHDLDKTIKRLLESELTLVDPPPAISFAPPDGSFAPSGPTVNLFLYDVQENRELRRTEPLVERQEDGTVRKRQPPARVECSYLVTVWSGDAENEHLILGEVMQALLYYPVIPVEFLQGVLADRKVPLPTAVLQQGRLQSVGEFWQAMGGKPHAALHYTVTLAVPVDRPSASLTVVSETVAKVGQPPALIAVEPGSAPCGETLDIQISGIGTHFRASSQVSFGDTAAIQVNHLTVADAVRLTVNLTIAADAPASVYPVSVTSGSEVVSRAEGFTIKAAA